MWKVPGLRTCENQCRLRPGCCPHGVGPQCDLRYMTVYICWLSTPQLPIPKTHSGLPNSMFRNILCTKVEFHHKKGPCQDGSTITSGQLGAVCKVSNSKSFVTFHPVFSERCTHGLQRVTVRSPCVAQCLDT